MGAEGKNVAIVDNYERIKYTQDGVEHEELIDNSEFSIMDEIVFSHVEEDNNG